MSHADLRLVPLLALLALACERDLPPPAPDLASPPDLVAPPDLALPPSCYRPADVLGPGAPPDSRRRFDESAPAAAGDTPRIAYPLDGASVPANLADLMAQWWGAAPQALYRLRFEGRCLEATFFEGAMACAGAPGDARRGCSYALPDGALAPLWQSALALGGGQLVLTIDALDEAGARHQVSRSIRLHVVAHPVSGAFHWFSPSSRGKEIRRALFGGGATSLPLAGGDTGCVGCHAVSADGNTLAATFYAADGIGGVTDLQTRRFLVNPTPTPGQAPAEWNFAAFDPTGRLLVTNWKGVLTVRSATSGLRKFDIPVETLGGRAVMPAWSPDGTALAFVQVGPSGRLGADFPGSGVKAGDWLLANAGSIAITRFDGERFQPARVVVPAVEGGEYHELPAFSPDGRFLVFVTMKAPGRSPRGWDNLFGPNAAPVPGWVLSYGQRDTRLRLVPVDGGAPLDLTSATGQAGAGVSWPRFVPETTPGRVAWLSYSSRFDYGVTLVGVERAQQWMSAIDLDVARSGAGDPSSPPFWLPFQSPSESNYAGAWSRRAGCATSDDCGARFRCDTDHSCVPR